MKLYFSHWHNSSFFWNIKLRLIKSILLSNVYWVCPASHWKHLICDLSRPFGLVEHVYWPVIWDSLKLQRLSVFPACLSLPEVVLRSFLPQRCTFASPGVDCWSLCSARSSHPSTMRRVQDLVLPTLLCDLELVLWASVFSSVNENSNTHFLELFWD